jgi:uncharacterized membrane protein
MSFTFVLELKCYAKRISPNLMSHISSILIILIVRTYTSKFKSSHKASHEEAIFKADLIDLMPVKSTSLLAYFGSVVFHGTQEVVASANRNKRNDKN